ncbi:MAG TPA: type II toxin-antitoxin system VapC family toxin [Tepidisphaeraceae bacterium]|nr:type II toxin-antitoxin system VapC family toxin [Tepidisphaeraceae bacterium]
MLLDSNIIIYASQPAHQPLRDFIAAHAPAVSAVSYVEVLGYHRLTQAERDAYSRFFAAARVLPLDQPVLDSAVSLRRQRRMSLGDSLVAGTALVHRLTLVTRNTDDFRWVPGLQLLDPLAAPPPAP